MNYELIALLVFVALLALFLILKRKKIEVQEVVPQALSFILYKTKIGLKPMDRLSKKAWAMRIFAVASVVAGFAGMALISVLLIYNLYKIAFVPSAVSGVALVLPVKAAGVLYVPFFYWIISILIIASVHEFSHGMIARFRGIKVKSSGFAFLCPTLRGVGIASLLIFLLFVFDRDFSNAMNFLHPTFLVGAIALALSFIKNLPVPIIPAAFVEPEEKGLQKKKTSHQLEVFAAGPFSNIALGFIFLGIFLAIAPPIVDSTLDFNGANITEISSNGVLVNTTVAAGDTILGIDSRNITFVDDFVDALAKKTPGQQVMLETDKGNYSVILGAKGAANSTPYLGVSVEQNRYVKPGLSKIFGTLLPNALIWVLGLIWWLYLLNLGIGIFNLVPVGPIDGGRMVYVSLLKKYREDKAKRIANWISIIFLMIIILNVVAGFIL